MHSSNSQWGCQPRGRRPGAVAGGYGGDRARSGGRDDQPAGVVAPAEGVEGLVDLVEGIGVRDHLVELQLAAHVEVDQAGEVDGRAGRAVEAALDGLLLAGDRGRDRDL